MREAYCCLRCACTSLTHSCTAAVRYFGAAKDLPGVRELFQAVRAVPRLPLPLLLC